MEDVPELVRHIFMRLQSRHRLPPPIMETYAIRRLQRHHWPGNVRELANICERLAILHPGGEVSADEVDAVLPPAPRTDGDESGGLTARLDDFERQVIIEALDQARGSISETARLLSTDRPNLYRRMKRLGIDR